MLSYSGVYFAKFGDFNSGFHNSAYNACMALGAVIYPIHFDEPITGVRGPVNEFQTSTCKTQYSYKSAGNVYWYDKPCVNPDDLGRCEEEVEVCPDGLPVEIGDYTSCDRPPIKQCVDGSIIETETEICSSVCTDYDTCYQYAENNYSNACGDATYFEFEYSNPSNWSYSCTEIDPESPDHPDNDGNQDNNDYNDPNSPTQNQVATVDPDTLSSSIDIHLQNDFGNVERAIREGTQKNTQENTDITNELADIKNGVDSQTDEMTNGLSDINSTLNDEFNKPSESYAKPTPYQYGSTIETVNISFYERIQSSNIGQSLGSIKNLILVNNTSCPEFRVDLPNPINESVSTDLHCELGEQIYPIMSPVMIIFWIIVGYRVFAGA